MGTLLVFCIYTYIIVGGWSLVNIPGDGSVWGINSTQFIREKALGSPAFYSLTVDINDAVTGYYLRVCFFVLKVNATIITIEGTKFRICR